MTNEISVRVLFDRYRLEIAIAVVATVSGLLLLHILRLRALIRLRTQELEIAIRRAEEEARTDPLSELPNRRHFLEVLARDVAQAKRQQVPLCLIAIDNDLFKPINDQYGHAAGDEALRRAGQVLQQTVRSGDVAARIGGEEFAVICLNTDIAEARTMAERIRLTMAETPISYRDKEFRITFSIGLAPLQRDDGQETLMHNADQALYAAKQVGRNTVREWSPQT